MLGTEAAVNYFDGDYRTVLILKSKLGEFLIGTGNF